MYNENIDIRLREVRKSNETPPPALIHQIKLAANDRGQRKQKRGGSRLLTGLAAAALCLVVGASAVAVSANLFGLRDLLLPSPPATHVEHPDGLEASGEMDYIALQGFTGSPEHSAAAQWQNFVNTFVGDYTPVPEKYQLYGAFSVEMIDKLYEIAETHGLRLYGNRTQFDSLEAFHASIANGPFLDDAITAYPGYQFESGTFQFDGQYGDSGFQLRSSRKGVFDSVFLMVDDIENFSEWRFESVHGTELLLMQSADRSLIILETETAFIVVNIVGHMDQSGLEHFANLIDFRQLR